MLVLAWALTDFGAAAYRKRGKAEDTSELLLSLIVGMYHCHGRNMTVRDACGAQLVSLRPMRDM